MLLEKLKEYTERIALPPTLYVNSPVRYTLSLDLQGRLLNPEINDTASKENKRGRPKNVPSIGRSGKNPPPLLLADKADYTLCFSKSDSEKDKEGAKWRHTAYMDLLEKCFSQTQDEAAAAVLKFLKNNPLEQIKLPNDFDPGGLITFLVDGEYVTDRPLIQQFWASSNNPEAEGGKPVVLMQCLICGCEKPVLERLQLKVKGVPDGNPSGTSLISANSSAFESFGLSASLIAPTCAECGEKFTKGLNHLLSNESGKSRVTLGGSAYIFWTREETDFDFFGPIDKPDTSQVWNLVSSLLTGKELVAETDSVAFYAASLSGSNARAVVRDWVDTTVGEVKKHTARWFALQRIVGAYGEPPFTADASRPYGLFLLSTATVREAKDISTNIPRALVRSAITGAPLPKYLLQMAVTRCRVERGVNRKQAALIKMVLLSNQFEFIDTNAKEFLNYMVEIDLDNRDEAYNCGRLLSLLEEAQRGALGDIGANVVDRFYGAASTTPQRVFSTLLRSLQNHLSKLEGKNKGHYNRLDREIQDVMANIKEFPKTLTLERQGLFALGYYHQRAYTRARSSLGAQQKKEREEQEN